LRSGLSLGAVQWQEKGMIAQGVHTGLYAVAVNGQKVTLEVEVKDGKTYARWNHLAKGFYRLMEGNSAVGGFNVK
jgi:hypothetical protein